ncbi:MAG: serine/threonine protein kinase [Deltaproteobacteria bacterium]|nr:serine/threonine protein kinase [Deltaproteobacteria bacterium]
MILPQSFGPYTLIERITVGGMAEVYRAKARGPHGFEKVLAVKRIHPKYCADRQFIKMLIDEAKINVQLTHLNIAQVFDLGRVDDAYYIALEFIDGRDLYRMQRRLGERGDAFSLEAALYVTHEIVCGLDYAHTKRDVTGRELRIVHRDVSPQNVLVSFDGQVKLIDFGIAKAATRTRETETGVIKGKFSYMSPEQAWGDPIDHRSDLFSAGIVLYELLTGRMLYDEPDDLKLLDLIRKADIVPPSTRRAEIPVEIDGIVLKALARRADDRYQSAYEFATALRRYMFAQYLDFDMDDLAKLMATVFPEADPGRARPLEVATNSTLLPESAPGNGGAGDASIDIGSRGESGRDDADTRETNRRRGDGLGGGTGRAGRRSSSSNPFDGAATDPGEGGRGVVPWDAPPSSSPGIFPPSPVADEGRRRDASTRSRVGESRRLVWGAAIMVLTAVVVAGVVMIASDRRGGAGNSAVGAESVRGGSDDGAGARRDSVRERAIGDSRDMRRAGESASAASAARTRPSVTPADGRREGVGAVSEPRGAVEGATGHSIRDGARTFRKDEMARPALAGAGARESARRRRAAAVRPSARETAREESSAAREEIPISPPPLLSTTSARATGPGFLTVNANQFAEVFIDGRNVGMAPVIRHELPAGAYRVRVFFPIQRRNSATERVIVRHGHTITLNFKAD